MTISLDRLGEQHVRVRPRQTDWTFDYMGGAREQDVEIRLATLDDAVAIASLLHKSFVEYEALYTSEGFAVTVGTSDMVRARMNEGPIWVAHENLAIVGTVSTALKGEKLYIRGMAVDPIARGKRIGRRLLDCAQEFALEKKCSCLFLSTTPFLSRAIRLYEDYGFHRNSEGPNDLFGTALFTMSKTLNAITEGMDDAVKHLQRLNNAVGLLVNQKSFVQAVDELSKAVVHSPEPFVWSVVDLNSIGTTLPDDIKSCWIFVLKKDVPSGCHYHPNSVQHMVVIKGQGTSKVGKESRRMLPFGSANAPEDVWYVIGKGVPHEFFPEKETMTVVSFHTCEEDQLEEVACDTGEKRLYEGAE